MSSKKTPSNGRQVELYGQKLRRMLIIQNLQIRSLKRECQHLKNKIKVMEQTNQGSYRFFYKLAYGCEVILNYVRKLFRRN